MSDTTARLRDQWASPADVSTILMVIGGDVVQKAFAQGTGTIYTPVCFSFGCVAYAFVALVSVIGHGRLLPEPDYPAKVINLESGYSRENKNWVVGRLLRDIETSIARRTPLRDNGIRISVFEALKNPNGRAGFSWSHIHYVGLIFIAVQLALAVVPIVLHRDWSVMLITGAGTVLVQLTGVLPQWRVEKLPNRQKSQANFALTSGNGSNDIIVILGRGRCLNLEEMAASASPRNGRPWEKLEWLSTYKEYPVGDPRVATRRVRESRYFRGLPLGFWITRITCSALSLLWLLLLINVAATGNNSWYLLGVGATGMFQNGWLAAVERPSKQRNLPIDLIETIRTKKVMDGLMDFEVTYGRARPLLEEFFPGKLKANELKWWNGDFEPFESERRRERHWRGLSRREIPLYRNSFTTRQRQASLDATSDDNHDYLPWRVQESLKYVDKSVSDPNPHRAVLSLPSSHSRTQQASVKSSSGPLDSTLSQVAQESSAQKHPSASTGQQPQQDETLDDEKVVDRSNTSFPDVSGQTFSLEDYPPSRRGVPISGGAMWLTSPPDWT